jgi:Zn-dependent M28 family amino/carboxypeptidase
LTLSAPGRSVLFFWTCGEERGLIGSDYYVQNPVVPLDKTVAVLNVDMIGRYFEDKDENADHLFVIGTTETSKEFDELVGSVNEQSVGLRLDRNDPANLFRRSDHYNFAKNGIPVVFFTTGLHKDYHRPSDEVQHIRFDKMHKVAELILRCGWEVANRDEVLKLNDPAP